ncbi:MAG: insulinase family protein [Actinobacteria bacterium]|nr:insulinase family protein [Actinomycetota bacterium]MCL5883053.1 insulinase family protein [Actinomycetota bacterium]
MGAGSRYEKPEEGGVSHFIEHLLFKGGARHDAVEIAQIFDSFGGELNAATSREYTVVHARFLDEHLEEAFEVMADMVIHPIFADIDLEREVVVEEIAMYEDSPGELITDYLTRAIFDGHPLGKSVLGTTKIIGAVTPGQIRGYHGSHYTLPNMVLAAAGNVDQEQVVELAKRHLSDGSAAAVPVAVKPGPLGTATSACFYEKDTQQYHVCFGGPGLARHSEKRFTLSILDGILGGSASSRLFQEVRDKRGLAYSVYSFDALYSDTGLVGVYFGCRGDSVAEATGIVVDQIRSIMKDGVTAEELSRAKESAKGRLVLSMETTHNRMSRLGKLTVTDSEILSLDEIIARIEAVNADDVRSLARELFEPDRLSAVAIGPDGKVFEKALTALGEVRQLEMKIC